MRKKLSFVIAAAVLVALAATNPYLAQAAAMITGGDIKDGTVASVDLKDGTVAGVDIAADTVRGSDVRNGSADEARLRRGDARRFGVRPGECQRRWRSYSRHGRELGRCLRDPVTTCGPAATASSCPPASTGPSSPVAMVDWPGTTGNEGAASVMYNGQCGTNGVRFITERLTVSGGPCCPRGRRATSPSRSSSPSPGARHDPRLKDS